MTSPSRAGAIRAAGLRGVTALVAVAIALQVALRVIAFGGLDNATRCVHMAGQLARAGIALAIVSVSPDCPAETVAPGGDPRHLIACAGMTALAVGLIYAGTSARALKTCRSVRALIVRNVWRRVIALAGAPVIIWRRHVAGYREPARPGQLPWHVACGTRGPPRLA